MKKLMLFFSFLLFPVFISRAANGCIANVPLQSNGKLYISQEGSYQYDAYGVSYTNPASMWCLMPTGYNCTVKGLGTYSGYEVTYSLPVGCPLDQYLILLGIGIGGLAYKRLKNYQNRLEVGENFFLYFS